MDAKTSAETLSTLARRASRQHRWRRFGLGATLSAMAAVSALGAWHELRRPPPLPATYDEITLPVVGLHCELWCPVRVDASLGKRVGIHEVRVDVPRSLVTVRYDGEQISPPDIAGFLRRAGYPPRELGSGAGPRNPGSDKYNRRPLLNSR